MFEKIKLKKLQEQGLFPRLLDTAYIFIDYVDILLDRLVGLYRTNMFWNIVFSSRFILYCGNNRGVHTVF